VDRRAARRAAAAARLRDAVKEIVFHGADRGFDHGVEHYFARSLPLHEAIARGCSGCARHERRSAAAAARWPAPLPCVPRWYGMASVKWLRAIRAIDRRPFDGFQQAVAITFAARSGAPFMACATRTSSRIASCSGSCARSECSTPWSKPRSAPWKTISLTASRSRARCQQPGERHAGPLGRRDASSSHGTGRVTRRDLAAPVAGALHGDANAQRACRFELGERQRKGPLHQTAEAEAPALVGRRDIEVDQQVVHPAGVTS